MLTSKEEMGSEREGKKGSVRTRVIVQRVLHLADQGLIHSIPYGPQRNNS